MPYRRPTYPYLWQLDEAPFDLLGIWAVPVHRIVDKVAALQVRRGRSVKLFSKFYRCWAKFTSVVFKDE